MKMTPAQIEQRWQIATYHERRAQAFYRLSLPDDARFAIWQARQVENDDRYALLTKDRLWHPARFVPKKLRRSVLVHHIKHDGSCAEAVARKYGAAQLIVIERRGYTPGLPLNAWLQQQCVPWWLTLYPAMPKGKLDKLALKLRKEGRVGVVVLTTD